MLKEFPGCSVAFIGSPIYDPMSDKMEGLERTQRFRVYSKLVAEIIGSETFKHKEFPQVSAYLLLNRENQDIDEYERQILDMFIRTYPRLLDFSL